MRKFLLTLLVLVALLAIPASVLAQDYYFQLTALTVNVYWNSDGTESIEYIFDFKNSPFGHPIEYVDVGLPNSSFELSSIVADVNGHAVTDITTDFQGEGSDGVAVGLGQYTIPPGRNGRVRVYIPVIHRVLYPDSQDKAYVSAVLKPAYFQSSVVYGTTDMTVTFHLPPGVQDGEARWHQAPPDWPQEPQTGYDEQGRIIYSWHNPTASPSTQYEFGASFLASYVPNSAIVRFDPFAWLNKISFDNLALCGCFSFFIILAVVGVVNENQRKMRYLPPRISIEGHGIKRGLTAIEAAILMEQPMDKILTMILFAVIKKNAAEVTRRDPLEIKVAEPLPEGLHDYEKEFLAAMQQPKEKRRLQLQDVMINLVKSVSAKMKGFSRRETVEYYKDITNRAWAQVEAANTPDVKSQKFDEVMEWTMLDRDYADRTRDVFRGHPVYVPVWWGRYDPTFGRASAPVSTGIPASGPVSLPHLPGSDFAASVAGGVQNFAGSVIGNISEFTSRVTNTTNPIPKSTSSGSRSGGRSGVCACACACAGCACACAGGGR